MIAGASILILLVILGVVIKTLVGSQSEIGRMATAQAKTAAWVALVNSYTKTPTLTSTVTLTPTLSTATPTLPIALKNQAAQVEPNGEVVLDGILFQIPGDGAQLKIYHDAKGPTGFLQAMGGTRLTFDYVNTDKAGISQIILRMEPGSQAFLSTGTYNGATLNLTALNLSFNFQGFFSIEYIASPPGAVATCYSGTCSYKPPSSSTQVPIAEGTQLTFDSSGALVGDAQPIPETDARLWGGLLPPQSASFDSVNHFIPTVTSTPTVTKTPLPTLTKAPTKAPPSNNPPANTPQPP